MQSINRVLEFSLEQGKFYLENSGEFYPFGSILKNDGTLVPLSVDMEEEYPDSKEILKILEENIIQRILNFEISAGAIGTDVEIKSTTNGYHKSAVEIRAISIDRQSINFYLPYVIKENEVYYQEVIIEEGTLIFPK